MSLQMLVMMVDKLQESRRHGGQMDQSSTGQANHMVMRTDCPDNRAAHLKDRAAQTVLLSNVKLSDMYRYRLSIRNRNPVPICWIGLCLIRLESCVPFLRKAVMNVTEGHKPDQYLVPEELRSAFFRSLHHGYLGGHQGVGKNVANLQRRFYWPGITSIGTAWCSQCHSCGENKPWTARRAALRSTEVGAKGEKVGAGLMGPFATTSSGMSYIIVMQDHFTKWIEARPLPNKAATTVCDAIVNMWYVVHGALRQLHSDKGTEFSADVSK